MSNNKSKETTIKAFGGFNHHEYAAQTIIITIIVALFSAYLFDFQRPQWVGICGLISFGVCYFAGIEGTPEQRQLADYMSYIDAADFKDLHKALKNPDLDTLSKSYIRNHMDIKYPDWNAPKRKSSCKPTVAKVIPDVRDRKPQVPRKSASLVSVSKEPQRGRRAA